MEITRNYVITVILSNLLAPGFSRENLIFSIPSSDFPSTSKTFQSGQHVWSKKNSLVFLKYLTSSVGPHIK